MENHLTKTIRAKQASLLFFFAYTVLLLRNLINISTFKVYLDVSTTFFVYATTYFSYALIVAKLVLFDREELFSILHRSAPMILVGLFVTFVGKQDLILELVLLVIGSKGVELDKIVKYFLVVAGGVYALFILLSLVGVIENFVVYRGERPRYSFGICYPTDFAAMNFYLLVAYYYLLCKKNKFKVYHFILGVVIALFDYVFCDARLDTVLILLLAVVALLYTYARGLFQNKITKLALFSAVPVCAIVMFALSAFYYNGNPFSDLVNGILTDRLRLGHAGLDRYGIPLFGGYVDTNGFGWSPTGDTVAIEDYFFIDCGFILFTLQYGAVNFLLVLFGLGYTIHDRLRKNDLVLPLAVLFVALTSMVDHHAFSFAYDPFIFALAVGLFPPEQAKKRLKGGLA